MGDEFDFLLQKVEEVLAKINKKREEILAADVLIMKLKDEKIKYKSEFLNKIRRLQMLAITQSFKSQMSLALSMKSFTSTSTYQMRAWLNTMTCRLSD